MFVVLHIPGPRWDLAHSPLDQDGVLEHLGYLQSCAERGDIVLGGPFLGAGQGGLMVTRVGMTIAEAQLLCESDPAVQSGLITYELRAWLVTIGNLAN